MLNFGYDFFLLVPFFRDTLYVLQVNDRKINYRLKPGCSQKSCSFFLWCILHFPEGAGVMNLVNQDETSLLMKQCSPLINHQSNATWVLPWYYFSLSGGRTYKSIATDGVLLQWPYLSSHKCFALPIWNLLLLKKELLELLYSPSQKIYLNNWY